DLLPHDGLPRTARDRRVAVHGRGRSHDRGTHVARARPLDGRGVRLLLALRRRGVGRHVPDDLRAAMTRRWSIAAVVLALAVTAAWLLLFGGRARAQTTDGALVQRGRSLYATGCVSCHGPDGDGVTTPNGELRGPSLRNAGAAAAYFQLSTGRMPRANSTGQAERKRPAYSSADIDALVAYVASLGPGPALSRIDIAHADLAGGGELYRANCAACHSAAGGGGALSYGHYAPSLLPATPLEVAGAVRSGPGQMPTFGPDSLSDAQVNDIAAYVEYLHHPRDPGGVSIGRTGPVPEGFVAWFFGMGALLAFVAWIGTRMPVRRRRRDAAEAGDG